MRMLVKTLLTVAISFPCLGQETEKPERNKPSIAAVGSARPDSTGESQPPSIWMRQKLKHSQRIFAAMVEGDLSQVEDSAQLMKTVNRLESFVRGKSKDYGTQLKLFQYANDEILKGAKERNLDRVTLGYNQMTISCVACHKQLRRADRSLPKNGESNQR